MEKKVILAMTMMILCSLSVLAQPVQQSVLSGGEPDIITSLDVEAYHCNGQDLQIEQSFTCSYALKGTSHIVSNNDVITFWSSGQHSLSARILLDANQQLQRGKTVLIYSSPTQNEEIEMFDGDTVKINSFLTVKAELDPYVITNARYNLLIKALPFSGPEVDLSSPSNADITFEGLQYSLDGIKHKFSITLDPDAISELSTPSVDNLKFLGNTATIPSSIKVSVPGLEWGIVGTESSEGFFTGTKMYSAGIIRNNTLVEVATVLNPTSVLKGRETKGYTNTITVTTYHGNVIKQDGTFNVPVDNTELGLRKVTSNAVLISNVGATMESQSSILTKTAETVTSMINVKPVVVGTPIYGASKDEYGTSASGETIQASRESSTITTSSKQSYAGFEEYAKSQGISFGVPLIGISALFLFIIAVSMLTSYAKRRNK